MLQDGTEILIGIVTIAQEVIIRIQIKAVAAGKEEGVTTKNY